MLGTHIMHCHCGGIMLFFGVPHNVAMLVPKLTGLRVVAEAGETFSDEHAAIHSLEHV